MLSHVTLKAISLTLALTCAFKAGPYTFNSCTYRLNMETRKGHRTVFHICSAFTILHFTYVLFRSLNAVLFHGDSAISFMVQLVIVSQAGLSVVCNLNTAFRSTEMADFINQYLFSDFRFTGNKIRLCK